MLSLTYSSHTVFEQIRQMMIADSRSRDSGNAGASSMTASLLELEEAVRELEAEGILQYISATQTVVIRGGR